MRWKRWLGILSVFVIVALLVAYGFREQPVPVEVAAVARGPLRVTIEEEGKTRVTDRFVVSAPVAGFARRIHLEVDDPVKRGQLIVVLEPQASAPWCSMRAPARRRKPACGRRKRRWRKR